MAGDVTNTLTEHPTTTPQQTTPFAEQGTRLLRLPEVMSRVGLKHSMIYLRMKEGKFPKQVSLGARAVGWLEHEIDSWLQELVSKRME